jgi:uncharacterized protein YqgC (DUF456 family)
MRTVETQVSLPRWLQGWSQERRRLFGWTAICLTVLIGVPAAGLPFILLFGVERCDSSSTAFYCSQIGRTLGALITIAILLPPFLKWAKFLGRILDHRDEDSYRE